MQSGEFLLPLFILLDQNMPREVQPWLEAARPGWTVRHTAEVGQSTAADDEVAAWAAGVGAIIVTFDEDFADQRHYPVGSHPGVVRLRVRARAAEAIEALSRLLDQVNDDDLPGALVVIGQANIRVRRL